MEGAESATVTASKAVKIEAEDVSSAAVRMEAESTPGPSLESKGPSRCKRVLREKAKRTVAKEEEEFSDGIPAAEEGSARKKRQRRSLQQDDHMEALVAAGMGFPHNCLTEEEIRAGVVGSLGGIEQANYIVIRNHILAKWRQNVDKWLPESLILENIRAEHKPLVHAAYQFLSQAGYINFGVSPAMKERVRTGTPKLTTMIVIGAGLAGLAAARQLVAFGHKVIVLEGRGRPGGRVHTRQMGAGGYSAAADLGGSVLTGTDGNPLGVLARQLKLPMHNIRSDPCPIYGLDGRRVDDDLDKRVEDDFNKLLDRAEETRKAIATVADSISLGSTLDTLRRSHLVAQAEDERQLLDWHMANLEYANAGLLHDLSLAYWDQDDPHEMAGDHCFLSGGNGRLVSALADGLPIFYGKNVRTVQYSDTGVRVHTSDGQVFEGDMALSTVPLGCLKRGDVVFDPPLPREKEAAMRRLGFGLLNKVALLFPHNFWGTDLDTFGRVAPDAARRGEYFLFYSYAAVSGGCLLLALVAGEAAKRFEKKPSIEVIAEVMAILRSMYEPQGVEVPTPLSTLCTRWGSDPFAYGSYSHVAVGSSGDDYDVMAESCGNGRLFFAGEATTRWHPATMHGALLTGLREAGWMDATAAARAAGQPLPVQIAPSSLSAQAVTLAEVFRNPDMEFGGFSVVLDPRSSSPSAPALLRLILRSVKSLTKPIKLPQDSVAEPVHTPNPPAETPAAPNGNFTAPLYTPTATSHTPTPTSHTPPAPIHTPSAPNRTPIENNHSSAAPVHSPAVPIHAFAAPIHTPTAPSSPNAPVHAVERPMNATSAPADAPGAATCSPSLPRVATPPSISHGAVSPAPNSLNPANSGGAFGARAEASTSPLNGVESGRRKPQVPTFLDLEKSRALAKLLQPLALQQPGSSENMAGKLTDGPSDSEAASAGAAYSQRSVSPPRTVEANQGLQPGNGQNGALGSGAERPLEDRKPNGQSPLAEAFHRQGGASNTHAGPGPSSGLGVSAPALPIVKDGKRGVLLPPDIVSLYLDTGGILERNHEPEPVSTGAEAAVHTSSAVPEETGRGDSNGGVQAENKPPEPFSFPVVGRPDSLRGGSPAGVSPPASMTAVGKVTGSTAKMNDEAGSLKEVNQSFDRGQSLTPAFGGMLGSVGGVNRIQKLEPQRGYLELFHADLSSGASGAKPPGETGPPAIDSSPSISGQVTDVRNDVLRALPSGLNALRTPSLITDRPGSGLAQNPPIGSSNALHGERTQAPVKDSPVTQTTPLASEPGTADGTQEGASILGNDPEATGPVGQASEHAVGKSTGLNTTPNGKAHPAAKKTAAAPTGKKRGKKRKTVAQAEAFTPQRELAVYTVITRGQAEQLRELKGGDRARLHTLVETFGVKLVGRHGLGSTGKSLLAALNGPHLVAGGLLPREEADAIKAGKTKKAPQANGVKPPLQLRPKRPRLEKGPGQLGSKEPIVPNAAIITKTVNETGKPEV